jgi:hypothetical protein
MTVSEFKSSLNQEKPPRGLSPALMALWWLGKNDWDKAHNIVMSADDTASAWIHAHLNRTEGDLENARYWYRQADREPATGDFAAEWEVIAATLLATPC